MSAEVPEDGVRRFFESPRRKDKLRNPPQFIDVPLLTQAVRVFGQGRSSSSVGAGTAFLIGSHTIIGTPVLNEKTVQVVAEDFNSSTPNVWFAIVHSRLGTVDMPLIEAAGGITRIGGLDSPLESFGPGTMKLYALGPKLTTGAGFAGIGSAQRLQISGKLLGYEL